MRHVGPHDHSGDGSRSATAEPAAGRRRPIGFLLGKLRDELLTLLRQELALARTETAEKVSLFSRNLIYAAAGGFIAFAGFIFLLLAATFGLIFALRRGGVADEHALWIAPLVVGAVIGLIGFILVRKAVATFRRESPVPRKTVQSLQEDTLWIRDKLRR